MTISNENYFDLDIRNSYVDVSTYKDVIGTVGRKGCETRALAVVRGEYVKPRTDALMVGSYVDSYFEGSIDRFKEENPEIFTRTGELKATYKQAETMIARCEKDDLFMRYMDGDKQVIFTGEIAGVPVRIKVDSFDGKRITDLKTCKSISETYYAKDLGERLDFCTYFGYIEQGAFYREVVRQATGVKYPFYIAAVSKDKSDNVPHPRIAVIKLPDAVLDSTLLEIETKLPKVWMLMQGDIEPVPCGDCDWCADNLPLERVISVDELVLGI